MRKFNQRLREELEGVSKDSDSMATLKLHSVKNDVKRAMEGYRKGELEKEEVADFLASRATEHEENKPLAVVADFIDILNRSAKGGQLNTAALRKAAKSLRVREHALDGLNPKEQTIALNLINLGLKRQEKRSRV